MPAGFNKGQVEYIKTIANAVGHRTYKPIVYPASKDYNANHLIHTHDTNCKYNVWCLTRNPLVRDTAGNIGTHLANVPVELDALNVPISSVTTDQGISLDQRSGAEAYLKSTHLKVRCTQVHAADGDFAADHNEYRMIVFRARDVQSDTEQFAKTHVNYKYDLFHGIANYKIGMNGYQHKEDPQGNLNYSNNSTSSTYNQFWADETGVMRLPVNKESWMVMKDVRFFLGRDYGGKNIYETTLHWNWEDPIDANSSHLDKFENDKNYCWYIAIFGNSNASGAQVPELNVNIIGTTHCESG